MPPTQLARKYLKEKCRRDKRKHSGRWGCEEENMSENAQEHQASTGTTQTNDNQVRGAESKSRKFKICEQVEIASE
jgi:hypothetical protein